MAADPIGIKAGVNLYLYGRASPMVYVDPNGMQEEPVTLRGEAPPPESPPPAPPAQTPPTGQTVPASEQPLGMDASGNYIYEDDLLTPQAESTGAGGYKSGWEATDPAEREVLPMPSPYVQIIELLEAAVNAFKGWIKSWIVSDDLACGLHPLQPGETWLCHAGRGLATFDVSSLRGTWHLSAELVPRA